MSGLESVPDSNHFTLRLRDSVTSPLPIPKKNRNNSPSALDQAQTSPNSQPGTIFHQSLFPVTPGVHRMCRVCLSKERTPMTWLRTFSWQEQGGGAALGQHVHVKGLFEPLQHFWSLAGLWEFWAAEYFPLAGRLTQCCTTMPIRHQRVICTSERQTNDLTMWIWRN